MPGAHTITAHTLAAARRAEPTDWSEGTLPGMVTDEEGALRQVAKLNSSMGLGLPIESVDQLLAAGAHAINLVSSQARVTTV